MDNRVRRREKKRFDVHIMGIMRTGSGPPVQAEITDLREKDRQMGTELRPPPCGPVFEHLRALIDQADKRRDRRNPPVHLSALAN